MNQNWTIYFAGRAIFSSEDGKYESICPGMLDKLNELNINLAIVTHDTVLKRNLKEVFNKNNVKIKVYGRSELRALFKNGNLSNRNSIFVGPSDDDLRLSASNKLLFINPGWVDHNDYSANKYGIKIESVPQLIKMLNILLNQHSWFYNLEISNKAEIISLVSANSLSYKVSTKEKDVLKNFREVLKNGKTFYRDALTFHLLSGMMQQEELYDIDIWAAMPSSGFESSEILNDLKDRCRYLTGKRMTEPLLIRYKRIAKSHEMERNERLALGARRLFDSVKVNPYYRRKLKGKTICVIDDYVTSGATTEMARNLLEKAGVKKIIFVTIGRYISRDGRNYQSEEYSINGDVFEEDYTVERTKFDTYFGKNAEINDSAKDEVKKIYDILNGSGDE